LINVLLGKRFEAALEAVGEDVTHGDKLDVRSGVQCVRGCAGAASATTDETDAERFAGRDLRAGEGDGGAEGEGGFDEFAAMDDGVDVTTVGRLDVLHDSVRRIQVVVPDKHGSAEEVGCTDSFELVV